MTLKEATEDNFSSLLRSMDPSLDLLGRLRSVPFVKDRISSIRLLDTDDLKNDALLNTLLEVPDDILESVMNGFISALRFSGQEHVANVFRRESDKVLMSDEHYELLSLKRSDLCKFMNPKDRLISSTIFSETDRRKILSKSTLNDMAEETVNILLRKSDCAYDKFVIALKETGQSHVSYLLTGDGNPPMSEEHRRILNAKMHDLENFTDTENGLLALLISRGVTTPQDAEQIRSLKGLNAMARKLVEIILRKSDDAFQQFVTLLREAGQEHVAYILTGEGNSRPLKEEHRRRLLSSPTNNLVEIMESKHSGLITALMNKGVFSTYDKERVTSVQPDTTDDRNEMILDLIARKSQTDFFNFISALRETDQTHAVVKLIGADVVTKIKTVYECGIDGSHIPDVDAELLKYMQETFKRNGEVVRRLNEILSTNGVSVSDVREGSIEVIFTCTSGQSLRNFQDLLDSGELENMISEAFCSTFSEKGLQSLKVVISTYQFEEHTQTFADWIPMTSEHREALLLSAEELVDKMTVNSDLLDKLPLFKRRRQAIESAATHEHKVKTLLDIVSRRPDSAFTQLLDALKDTQQTEAADIISSYVGSKTRSRTKASESHETDIGTTDELFKAVKTENDRLKRVIADLSKVANENRTVASESESEMEESEGTGRRNSKEKSLGKLKESLLRMTSFSTKQQKETREKEEIERLTKRVKCLEDGILAAQQIIEAETQLNEPEVSSSMPEEPEQTLAVHVHQLQPRDRPHQHARLATSRAHSGRLTPCEPSDLSYPVAYPGFSGRCV